MNLNENEILRCPKCGATKFHVSAHVVQDWEVDAKCDFLACLNDCVEVAHHPAADDMFSCAKCGYDAVGEEFITKVDLRTSYDRLCALLTDYEGKGSGNKPGIEDLRAEVNTLLAEWPVIVVTLTDKKELTEREAILERLRLVKDTENERRVYAVLGSVRSNWDTLIANRTK